MHEKSPLFLVPEVGTVAPHATAWELLAAGALSWHEAKATPDFASVTVMLQVTFCAAADTLTAVGESVKVVSPGAKTSGSDVMDNVDGNPRPEGSMGPKPVFPTASGALTLAVHGPDGEYRGNVITHDHVPFCRVPEVGAAAVQLCR